MTEAYESPADHQRRFSVDIDEIAARLDAGGYGD